MSFATFHSHPMVLVITAYQRFISPHKGFRCAHAALHKGHSCSQAVKLIIADQGVWKGWHAIKQRFAECRTAALELSNRRDEDEDRNNPSYVLACKNRACKNRWVREAADCSCDSIPDLMCSRKPACDCDLPCDLSCF